MHRTLLFGLSLLSFLAGCGGCPWAETSAVGVSPSRSCLTLTVADGSGTAPSTGCVNPVLYGSNGCTDILMLPAADAERGAAVTVAPGESFTYEINYGAIHSRQVSIEASLGSTPITIAFSVSGGYLK